MKISTTKSHVLNTFNLLLQLGDQITQDQSLILDGHISYALNKNKTALMSAVQKIQRERYKILEQHCELDESGNVKFEKNENSGEFAPVFKIAIDEVPQVSVVNKGEDIPLTEARVIDGKSLATEKLQYLIQQHVEINIHAFVDMNRKATNCSGKEDVLSSLWEFCEVVNAMCGVE